MSKNNRLRAARVLLGLTQHQLAAKAEIKEMTVSRLETGRAQPTPELRARIAAILQKPAYELFEA